MTPNLLFPQLFWVADDEESALGFLDRGRPATGLYRNPNTCNPTHEPQGRVNDVTAGAGDGLHLKVIVGDLDLEPEIIKFWGLKAHARIETAVCEIKFGVLHCTTARQQPRFDLNYMYSTLENLNS